MRSRRQYWRVAGAWRRLSWPRPSGCCATVARTSSCARSGCAARARRASRRRQSSIGCASAMPRWPPIWPGSASAVARSATRLSALEADRTRLRDLDEQLERDLGDAQIALEDARSASARLEAERAGLVDQQAEAASRREQAARRRQRRRRRSRWPRPSCARPRSPGGARGRARQIRERLVGSADRGARWPRPSRRRSANSPR